ncbi:MAG: hypothetical protein Q8P39_03960 [Candidatus Yanofskybacteria bacterium]|nr:hypothetical protein [Candidatus Yanofskybacteria bacterium]
MQQQPSFWFTLFAVVGMTVVIMLVALFSRSAERREALPRISLVFFLGLAALILFHSQAAALSFTIVGIAGFLFLRILRDPAYRESVAVYLVLAFGAVTLTLLHTSASAIGFALGGFLSFWLVKSGRQRSLTPP